MDTNNQEFHRFFSKREGLVILNEVIKEHKYSTLKQAINIVKNQYLKTIDTFNNNVTALLVDDILHTKE